jgi:hypothetical protein
MGTREGHNVFVIEALGGLEVWWRPCNPVVK